MSTIAILDCRPLSIFSQGHALYAACIPAESLAMRMHELPKTSCPLVLYGDEHSLPLAQDFLRQKGYQVQEARLWNDAMRFQLACNNQLVFGSQSQRLWQPAPLIEHFVNAIMPAQQIQPARGLDIACGAGRDMVYLAMHGWQMLGVDYIPGALQRAEQLADTHEVKLTTACKNLEMGGDPFSEYPSHCFELICVMRYLHRPLFPYLKRLLTPKGIFIQQTFMQGCEQYGSPKNPNFLLKPGELTSLFRDAEILLDNVVRLEDGRPVSAFVARMR